MNINHTFNINDEPFLETVTGQRSATLRYLGKRYIYAEACTERKEIFVVVHKSDERDLATAEERLTPTANRVIIEVDATENVMLAAYLSRDYEIDISDYEEDVGEEENYTYNYGNPPSMEEIFDYNSMEFDFLRNDFIEYKYLKMSLTNDEFKPIVLRIIGEVDAAISNGDFTESDMEKLVTYKNELELFLPKLDVHHHWKLKFPSCSVAY